MWEAASETTATTRATAAWAASSIRTCWKFSAKKPKSKMKKGVLDFFLRGDS